MRFQLGRISRVRVIVLSFLLVILIGTLLLWLPCSTRNGLETSLLDALFTAVSATCVTGLVVVDTWSHWTVFGQIVILLMIQIGGLGFITIAALFFMMTKKQMNLSTRTVLQDSISATQNGGVFRLTRKILKGTILIETCGTLLLSVRFVPVFGIVKGLYYSVFHSVSAFCNAGFDLMGGYSGAFSSFSAFYGDTYVTAVLCLLILIGGIGFLTWNDITVYGRKVQRYSLQTKMVLSATVVLILIPVVLFYITEYNGLMQGYSIRERITASLFCAVAPRTAGFNSVEITDLSESGYFMTVILMFIGGASGSTAGGVKITTIVVMMLSCVASMRQEKEAHIFGRRLDHDIVAKAANVFVINLSLASVITAVICFLQPLSLHDIFFETISAISTVGMTTGVTRALGMVPRLLVAFLMFCGRVGSLSFALAVTNTHPEPLIKYPTEHVITG